MGRSRAFVSSVRKQSVRRPMSACRKAIHGLIRTELALRGVDLIASVRGVLQEALPRGSYCRARGNARL